MVRVLVAASSSPSPVAQATGATAGSLGRWLLAMAVVVASAALGGALARRVRQPAVVGQIVAGVVLGPSVFGAIAPSAAHHLFGTATRSGLQTAADLGLVLFMFLVGAELDPGHLRGAGRTVSVVTAASIGAPFVAGASVAWWLHARIGTGVATPAFAAFVGVAMAVTAFPVLAQVLRDVGLHRSRVGTIALACAAVGDVVAWCALAAVAASVNASGASALRSFGGAVAAIVLALAARRLLERIGPRTGSTAAALGVALAFAGAAATDWLGLHAVFGAFLAGLVVAGLGHDMVCRLSSAIEPAIAWVLLPAFFVMVGLSTRVDRLDGSRWVDVAVVLVVAVVAKLGASAGAARLVGEDRGDALTLGVLLNTRGLTEIVLLAAGRDLGIIGDVGFTVLVIMAVLTTVASGPLLAALGHRPVPAPTLVPPEPLE